MVSIIKEILLLIYNFSVSLSVSLFMAGRQGQRILYLDGLQFRYYVFVLNRKTSFNQIFYVACSMCLDFVPFGDERSAGSVLNMSESDPAWTGQSTGPSRDSIISPKFTVPGKISPTPNWLSNVECLFLYHDTFSLMTSSLD